MERVALTLAAALIACVLAGCGISDPYRSSASKPSTTSTTSTLTSTTAPADLGDPPGERNGTVPAATTAAQDRVKAGAGSTTPRAAVTRYADLYINWTAGRLASDQRKLASISIGAARLQAQQAAASAATDTTLTQEKVTNSGQVISAQPGSGPAAGKWVIVTAEKTVGAGDYQGLPPALHVTYAKVANTREGWVISQWAPQN